MRRILLVVVLLVLTGCGAPVELPRVAEPARSVEEVADRLRAFELREESPHPAVGDVFQLCPGTIDTRAPAEPQAFPTLVAHLKTDPPVHARFMLLPDAAQAARLVAQAAGVARGCAGAASGTVGEAMDAETTVSAFDRDGWSGTQLITSGRAGSDTDDPFFYKPFTTGQMVAHQGAWVVELGWSIGGGFGSPDSGWAGTGLRVSQSVLAVADGAVTAPRPQDRLTRVVRALPDPGAYGERLQVWPEPGKPRQYREQGDGPPMTNDLSCGALSSREHPPEFVPSVERSLLGEVAVHELVSVAQDERQAEHVRRAWLHAESGSPAPDPCVYSDPGFVHTEQTGARSVAPSVTAFRHGEWAGEIERFAARHPEATATSGPRDSYAQVAIAVRKGTMAVYLRWQGPGGVDPHPAFSRGESALRRTLDRLAAVG
ncbi:hypothetical protein [Nonomuraea gerenzanensis]|uniref:Lipoprotein n=1 Tax=Nonomuraea gerenzanensis TaxID=93944 RepID=A0A1M4EFC9_9ACTN|nr:hypothetical protein [Nonomuraea gerenzanensis]UBU08996.1 hypothetical protein LCN96_31990 [Nonomuraea gerenzanensis]SBO97378.1 hypothetical protein BN4615_P6894 [Nonomuraea gerenzanensis]